MKIASLSPMMLFLITLVLFLWSPLTTALFPTPSADYFYIKLRGPKEGDAKNVRSMEFDVDATFISYQKLNIAVDADIIVLPQDPSEKISCSNYQEPLETVATSNSLTFTFNPPVKVLESIHISCQNIKFDFNSVLDLQTFYTFSFPEHPSSPGGFALLRPVNDDIPVDSAMLSDRYDIVRSVRSNADGTPILNTRDFSFKIRKSIDINYKLTQRWEDLGLVKMVNEDTPVEEIGCKIVSDFTHSSKPTIDDDFIPAQYHPQHRSILFDFTSHPIPSGSDFDLDCKGMFYLDLRDFVDVETRMYLSIPGDNTSSILFHPTAINDNTPHGFFKTLSVDLVPLPAVNKRDFSIKATGITAPIVPTSLILIAKEPIITQIDVTKPPQCTINQLSVPAWVSPNSYLMYLDISDIAVLEGDIEITCTNAILFDFAKAIGTSVGFVLTQPRLKLNWISTSVAPINDEGWFSSVSVDLLRYPDEENPTKNTRGFVIEAKGATGTIGRDISIVFQEMIVRSQNSQNQNFENSNYNSADSNGIPSCFINDTTEVFTVIPSMGDKITLKVDAGTFKEGDSVKITCTNTWLDFSLALDKEIAVSLTKSQTPIKIGTTLPPINDDIVDTLFESFDVEMRVQVDPETQKPVLNRRKVKFFAKKAKTAIEHFITLSTSHPIMSLSTPLTCTDLDRPEVHIVATVLDDGLKMDLGDFVLRMGDNFSFECALIFDFSSHLDQAIDITLKSDSNIAIIVQSDLINDEKEPPSELFDGFGVTLSKFEDNTRNLRNFKITATALKKTLNTLISFKLSQPIVVSTSKTPPASCSWGPGDANTMEVRELTENGTFKLDFAQHPVPKETENFFLTCSHLHFDFSKHRAEAVSLVMMTVDENKFVSVANIAPVDDGDDADDFVDWPMKLNMPIRSQYQSFMTLNIDNIPTHAVTGSDELALSISFAGAQIDTHQTHNNGTLHYITLTSFASEKTDETPTTSGFPITVSHDGIINSLPIKFPPNHVKLSVSVQVATVKTLESVKASVNFIPVNGNKKTYSPDEKTTPISWKYNDSMFDFSLPKNNTAAIKTVFNSFLGEKKKGTYGPSFEIIFPKTLISLKDNFITLRTNTSHPLVDTTPSFFFNNKTKTPSCTIPQFGNHAVAVKIDGSRKELTFDLSGVKQLEKAGEAFTLKCPNIATIIPNPDHPEQSIAFTLSSSIGGQVYSDSWIATPNKEKKSHAGKVVGFIIAALVIFAAVFFGVKKYKQYKQRADSQPLLGEVN